MSLCILIPVMAISLLTNQEIFNAYLVWGDQHFKLTFMRYTMPISWLITLDATLSFSMLVAVAAVLEMVEPQARASPTRSAR